MVFNHIGSYRQYNFVNIESATWEDVAKDLGDDAEQKYDDSLPEEEVASFCLWLKEIGKPHVGKVTLSKRLKDEPMVLFGEVSSSMRHMMTMMQA